VLGVKELVARFRDLEVVVVGDVILDSWTSGPSHRLCREAPVPVVTVERRVGAPGGAANTAANLAALGARVRLVSAVGADAAGAELGARLRELGVDETGVLTVPGRATVAKRRVLADGQILVRYDEGDTTPLQAAEDRAVAEHLDRALDGAAALVVCDYGGGTLGDAVRARIAERPRGGVPLLVVDAHDLARWAEVSPTVVTPNVAEAVALLGEGALGAGPDRAAGLDARRADLLARSGAEVAVVTLDRDGSVLLEGTRPPHRTYADPAPPQHTAGAGDSFVAGLTLALAAGAPSTTAAELAQLAAQVVVGRPGTSTCSAVELLEAAGAGDRRPLGVEEVDVLVAAVAAHRGQGRRIVFTNGAFDGLHRGHVAYLNQAKVLGDVLVVAVNSDTSVARLSGPPANPTADRAEVLAALSCVDHVVVFEEDSPVPLLEAVRPDVYVKGGDYTAEMVPERPVVERLGGEVRIVDYVEDRSTPPVVPVAPSAAGTGTRSAR